MDDREAAAGLYEDFYADFQRERSEEMLDRLEISAKQRMKHMSKGTREKVQLILAMSRQAKLYLLDEPIGGGGPGGPGLYFGHYHPQLQP